MVTLLQESVLARQNLVAKEKEYGPEHAEVLKANASVEDLHRCITNRVDGVMKALEAKVMAVKKGLEDLDEEFGAAKTNDIMTASQSRPYFDAKRRLDEMLRFRQILDMKIASEQIDVALPKTVMVEIMDTAKPGVAPRASRTSR